MSAQNDEPPRGKGESEDAEYSERVAARLLDGADDERQAILEGLSLLSAPRQASVRPYLKDAISKIRKGTYSDERMGWLTSALVIVAGEDSEARHIIEQHSDQKFEANEWVRYWTLAQLFWTRGSVEAAQFARARAVDDESMLVAELALAIIRHSTKEPPRLAPMHEEDRVFARLRALQVVAAPAAVPELVQFMLARGNSQLTYEALRALTASPDVTQIAARVIAETTSPARLADIVVDSLSGVRPRLISRLARLFSRFPPGEADRALIDALKAKGLAESPVRRLFDEMRVVDGRSNMAPASLPPGAWRAELAYRSVLQQPTTFDLLESLSAAQLSAILQQAGIAASDAAPDALAARVQALAPGGAPNALWRAWIENVQAARLTQD